MLGGHISGLAQDISVGGVNFSDDSGPGVLEYMPWNNHYHHNYRQAQGNQKVLSFDGGSLEKGYMGSGGSGIEGDGMARISAPGKCRLMREGDEDKEWHMCTKEELFRLVRGTRLIWLPGEMVSCRYTPPNSNYEIFISLYQISCCVESPAIKNIFHMGNMANEWTLEIS